MKGFAYIYKSVVVVALVAAIFNTYFTEYICNIKHELAESAESHSNNKEHEHSLGNHAEDHHSSDSAKHHPHSPKANDENCCKGLSSKFYLALNKQVNPIFRFTKTFATVQSGFYSLAFIRCDRPSPSDFFCYKSPQPKIPDIRIFIQSFLI